MKMGDWNLFTNQLGGINEKIKIRGLLLYVECKPCVVYGGRGLGDGSPSFLYRELLKEWKEEKCCMRKEKLM
jgi:hypothetical protein